MFEFFYPVLSFEWELIHCPSFESKILNVICTPPPMNKYKIYQVIITSTRSHVKQIGTIEGLDTTCLEQVWEQWPKLAPSEDYPNGQVFIRQFQNIEKQ